jgi:hypothetical protein
VIISKPYSLDLLRTLYGGSVVVIDLPGVARGRRWIGPGVESDVEEPKNSQLSTILRNWFNVYMDLGEGEGAFWSILGLKGL